MRVNGELRHVLDIYGDTSVQAKHEESSRNWAIFEKIMLSNCRANYGFAVIVSTWLTF